MNPSKVETVWTKIAIAVALTLATGQAAGAAASPAPVDLGTAADFVVLTKTGITNVPPTDLTGDLGTSPIASTAITGLTLILDGTGTFSTSTQVTGKIYAADYAAPTPSKLTTAVGNMETAYTDAAGRSLPDFTELYSGDLSGRTLAPGLYKWSTGVLITTDVTLDGPADAVWIFQISNNLTVGSDASVLLSGAANANNIFWQVGGGVGVEIGTGAHFEGTILAAKAIHLRTGSSLVGRALSQTATTLEMNAITISTAQATTTTTLPPPGPSTTTTLPPPGPSTTTTLSPPGASTTTTLPPGASTTTTTTSVSPSSTLSPTSTSTTTTLPIGTFFEIIDAPDNIRSGETLAYTMVVTNAHDYAHGNVRIVATWDTARLAFVSATRAPDPGGCCEWSLGAIAPGKSATVTARFAVQPGLADGQVLDFSAIAQSDDDDPLGAFTETRVSVGAADRARLGVAVVATPDPVRPGEDVRFVATYTNSGSATAVGATASWFPPTGMGLVGSTLEPLPGGSLPVVFELGDLSPAASRSFTYFAQVDARDRVAPVGSVRKPCLRVDALPASPGGTTAGLSATACTAVVTSSEATRCRLILRQRPLKATVAGKRVSYSLLWFDSCYGVDAARVEFPLPDEYDFMSATGSGIASVVDRTVVVEYGSVRLRAVNDTRLQFRVKDMVPEGTSVQTFATLTDSASRSVTAVETVTTRVTPSPSTTRLPAVSLAGTRRSANGRSVSYTVRYRNVEPLNDLAVTLPQELAVESLWPPPLSIDGGVARWQNLASPSGVVKIRGRVSVQLPSPPVVLLETSAILRSVLSSEVASATFYTSVSEAGPSVEGPGPTTQSGGPVLTLTGVRYGEPDALLLTDLRFRDAVGPTLLTLTVPDALTVEQQTVAPASAVLGTLAWDELASNFASKIRFRIAADTPRGTVLRLVGTVTDSRGQSATQEYAVTIR